MLAFIGFIALLIFGKFLWDTYVTGKTEKDWQSYKKNEPEKAARITNSATFDMSTDYKPNSMHQQASLNMIAAQLECEASEAKETYQNVIREELAKEAGSFEHFKQSIKEIRQHKYKQALSMEFDPDNTPAAFMERWMQEVLDEYLERINNKTNTSYKASAEEISKALAKFGIKPKYNYDIGVYKNKSKITDSKLQSNATHRTASLLKLVRQCKCATVEWVKEVFTSNMVTNKVSLREAKLVIQILNSWIQDEARSLNISPQDTTAAIQIEWINYYIYYELYSTSWKNKEEMLEDMYSLNPDFELAYRYGDAEKKREFLLDNLDFMSKVNKLIEEFDLEAHTILAYANQSIKERDYNRVLMLLEKAFALGDESVNAELYNARGKALLATFKVKEALADFDKAIELISLREGNNLKCLNEFIENKTEAQEKMKEAANLYSSVGAAFGVKPKLTDEQDDDMKANAIKQEARQARLEAAKAAIKAANAKPAIKVEEPAIKQQKESFEAGDEVSL